MQACTANWPSAYGYWEIVPLRVPALTASSAALMPSTEMMETLPVRPALRTACAAPRPMVSLAAKIPVIFGWALRMASVTVCPLAWS